MSAWPHYWMDRARAGFAMLLCLGPTHLGTQYSPIPLWLSRQRDLASSAGAHWLVMVLVMVPILAAPAIRFVAARSFVRRRGRAIAFFLLPLLTAWSRAGLAPIATLLAVEWSNQRRTLAICASLLTAALWQITPYKQAALLACHRTVPLAPNGWRADANCARFACRYGMYCVLSCWALMFRCVLTDRQWLIVAIAWWIALHERIAVVAKGRVYLTALLACAVLTVAPLPRLSLYG